MFDFKDSLDKRAKQVEQNQNHRDYQKDTHDRTVAEFKTAYLEWYKKCEELNVVNNIDSFLCDIGFKLLHPNSTSTYYKGDIGVGIYRKVISNNEVLPFKFGIVCLYSEGCTTLLKLLGDKVYYI